MSQPYVKDGANLGTESIAKPMSTGVVLGISHTLPEGYPLEDHMMRHIEQGAQESVALALFGHLMHRYRGVFSKKEPVEVAVISADWHGNRYEVRVRVGYTGYELEEINRFNAMTPTDKLIYWKELPEGLRQQLTSITQYNEEPANAS